MTTSLSRTVARNLAFGMAAQLVIKVASFAFSVLIVRHLGADVFGQYAAVLAFGGLFVFLSDLGLSPYMVREVALLREKPDGKQKIEALFGNILALRLVLSIMAAILLIVSAWLSGRPTVMIGAIALNALGLVMYSVHGASDSMLGGFERLDRSARARVAYQLLFVCLGAAALYLGLGYYGLIGATLVSIAYMTYLCWLAVRQLGVRPSGLVPATWPALLRASLPFGIMALTIGLSSKFDSVILSFTWTDRDVGYYNAVYNLVFSATVISNIVNFTLYPSLARRFASGPQSLVLIYERTAGYLLMASLPIAVGVWALAEQVLLTLFTRQYSPAVPALQIIIWVVPLMYLSEFMGYAVAVRGQEGYVARSMVVSSGINVVLNAVFVPKYGFIGAAAMTVFTEVVLVCQYLWLLRDLVRQLRLIKVLVLPLIAVGLMGLVTWWQHAAGVSFWTNVVVSALVYIGALVAMGALGADELRLLRGLRTHPKRPEASAEALTSVER